MARKNTGWLSDDGKVHETKAAAESHDARTQVGTIIAELLDLDLSVDTVKSRLIALVAALARPEVIADLRRLVPHKPRKPRAPKKASTE